MRVGKDQLWGYSFKIDSGISFERKTVVGATLAKLCEHHRYFTDSNEFAEGIKVTLTNPGHIFGIGMKGTRRQDSPPTIGIIWGPSDNNLLEALYRAEICQVDDAEEYFEFWPYKIRSDCTYDVVNGEVFERDRKKNKGE